MHPAKMTFMIAQAAGVHKDIPFNDHAFRVVCVEVTEGGYKIAATVAPGVNIEWARELIELALSREGVSDRIASIDVTQAAL